MSHILHFSLQLNQRISISGTSEDAQPPITISKNHYHEHAQIWFGIDQEYLR